MAEYKPRRKSFPAQRSTCFQAGFKDDEGVFLDDREYDTPKEAHARAIHLNRLEWKRSGTRPWIPVKKTTSVTEPDYVYRSEPDE